MITQLLVFFFILFLNNIVSQQELTNVTYSLLIAARNDQYCGNSPERSFQIINLMKHERILHCIS